jgi:hypothetical protein
VLVCTLLPPAAVADGGDREQGRVQTCRPTAASLPLSCSRLPCRVVNLASSSPAGGGPAPAAARASARPLLPAAAAAGPAAPPAAPPPASERPGPPPPAAPPAPTGARPAAAAAPAAAAPPPPPAPPPAPPVGHSLLRSVTKGHRDYFCASGHVQVIMKPTSSSRFCVLKCYSTGCATCYDAADAAMHSRTMHCLPSGLHGDSMHSTECPECQLHTTADDAATSASSSVHCWKKHLDPADLAGPLPLLGPLALLGSPRRRRRLLGSPPGRRFGLLPLPLGFPAACCYRSCQSRLCVMVNVALGPTMRDAGQHDMCHVQRNLQQGSLQG